MPRIFWYSRNQRLTRFVLTTLEEIDEREISNDQLGRDRVHGDVVPALCRGRFSFHVRETDGRTGLLSNPDHDKLNLSQQMLDKAAKDRVLVLSDATGTHWKWLLLSWYADKPRREYGINDRGGASPDKADIALSAGQPGFFRLHCLREQCRISIRKSDQSEVHENLKRGHVSKDIPFDVALAFSF